MLYCTKCQASGTTFNRRIIQLWRSSLFICLYLSIKRGGLCCWKPPWSFHFFFECFFWYCCYTCFQVFSKPKKSEFFPVDSILCVHHIVLKLPVSQGFLIYYTQQCLVVLLFNKSPSCYLLLLLLHWILS